MGRLQDRVALVTGAASGIGAACALRFAEEGALIAGFDLQKAAAGKDWEAAVECASASHFETGDIRDDAAVGSFVAGVKDRFGRVDILVNAAGVAGGGPVHLIPPEEWDRVVDINLKGTYLANRHALPHMIEQRSGNIINIASVEGIEGFEGGSSYNASKGAVMILTKNMAIDYGRRGIRVNAICPGFIETPMMESVLGMEAVQGLRDGIREAHQLGRFGKAVEIANAAVFLASDEASFVTGHGLVVDGGYSAGHTFGIRKMMGLD